MLLRAVRHERGRPATLFRAEPVRLERSVLQRGDRLLFALLRPAVPDVFRGWGVSPDRDELHHERRVLLEHLYQWHLRSHGGMREPG